MKRCLLFVLALLSLNLTVWALGEPDISIKGKETEITVSGKAAENETVSVFASKTVRATDYKDIVFVDEILCDETGEFKVVFNMPDKFDDTYDATGSYTVYVSSKTLGKTSKVHEYVSLKKQKKLLEEINDFETSNEVKESLLKVSNANTFLSMGINIDGYKSYTALQDDIADIIFDSIQYDSISDFVTKYNDSFVTALVNNVTSTTVLKNELKDGGYMSFVVDGVDISKDSEIFNSVIEYLFKHRNYLNASEIKNAIKDGVVVYNLNRADKLSLTDVVKKYAEYIGVNDHKKFASYTNSRTMQTVVNEKTIFALSPKGADTISAFVSEFETQLEEYEEPSLGGGGGIPGGTHIGVSGFAQSSEFEQNLSNQEDFSSLNNVVFKDMENVEWAKDAVLYLYKNGIVNGTSEKEFSPDMNVTREQFAKMIVGFAGTGTITEIPFSDVEENSWYCDYVKKAYSAGLINGISDNLFGTGNFITREDAAVIIARCVNLLGISADDTRENIVFNDYNEISDYAKESVEFLYKKGIINGVSQGVFSPKSTLTRAEAAKMIYELCRVRGDVI